MMKLVSKNKNSGQTLIETAIILMLLIVLTIGWIGEGIQIVSRVELTNALQLATVSATQAEFYQGGSGNSYAKNTFTKTIASVPFLNSDNITLSCGGAYYGPSHPVDITSLTLTCTAKGAKVLYTDTPLGLVYPVDINLGQGPSDSISYTVQAPFFRTCNLIGRPCG